MYKCKEYLMIAVAALAFLLLTGTWKSNAGILDTIKTVIGGHTSDVIDRVSVDNEYVDGVIVSNGDFNANENNHRDRAHYVNGTVSIVLKDGVYYVQLNDDFKAGFAPDLYVYVSETINITSIEDFKSTKQVELSKLKKGSGATWYKLPADFNIGSVTIWCKEFAQFMGSANLVK